MILAALLIAFASLGALDWYSVIVTLIIKASLNAIAQTLPRLDSGHWFVKHWWGALFIRFVHGLCDNFGIAFTGRPAQTPSSTGRYLASKLLEKVKAINGG